MQAQFGNYGIVGQQAPEWQVEDWIDGQGRDTTSITLASLKGKRVVLFGFQSWCPGCHSSGFPTLQKLVERYESDPTIQFLAVQTVFEGFHANTRDKIVELQRQFGLSIPFGHDSGSVSSGQFSDIMFRYHSGGTPWFIVIDEQGEVVYNDFRITLEEASALLSE